MAGPRSSRDDVGIGGYHHPPRGKSTEATALPAADAPPGPLASRAHLPYKAEANGKTGRTRAVVSQRVSMSPVLRRIVYVSAYEGFAILFSTLMFVLLGHDEASSGMTAVIASAVAVAWNFVFTTAFEWWEARNPVKGRSVGRRIAHAVLFEGGLALVLTPVLALTLGVPLAEAFVTNIGLLLFFLVYTYAFNLAFDKIFGLPLSAR